MLQPSPTPLHPSPTPLHPSHAPLHPSHAHFPGGFLNKTTLKGYIILTPTNPRTNPELPSTRPQDLPRMQGGGASLLQLLREVLPGHCVPDTLTILDSFPMTTHGEVKGHMGSRSTCLCTCSVHVPMEVVFYPSMVRSKSKFLLSNQA